MNDKMQQNQSQSNHNVGVHNWSQQWQNISNPYAQQRPFGFWPQWGSHYPMNMGSPNPLPHHAMPFQPMHLQNFNFPHMNLSTGNLNNSNNSVNNNQGSAGNVGNGSNNQNPPLPGPNSKKNEETSKVVENPDKIPLPDGPPPLNKNFPPLPAPNNSILNPSRPFFNSNTQPIKFNLSNQNKTFTPFNLPGKKNKKNKNKNQQTIPFAAMFNKPNMQIQMNFTPGKILSSTTANPPLPPLPPGNPPEVKNNSQGEAQPNSEATPKEVPTVSPFQNQQASHNDWPPSLLNYIERCYLKCETSMDKDQVGIILKGKITSAMSSNTLFTKNWDLEPLPNLRGTRVEQPPVNQANNNMNVINMNNNLKNRNKFGESIKNRLGKNRNYRGAKKKSLSKSPSRDYRSRSKSLSRSRSRSRSKSRFKSRSMSRSRSRSRSSSSSPRRRHRNSDSNSSDENSRFSNKSKTDKKNSKKGKRKQKRSVPFYPEISLGEHEGATTERLQQRAARFKETLESPKGTRKPLVIASSFNVVAYEDTEGDFDYNDLHIVGTCQELEKPFLRLTSAPDASQVRPSDVLEKSLELIKSKWIENSDYRYTCEQLKSIRQDLTVQGIRNDFTVKVYETHARICLEKGDPEEFNQCQTQLRMLYSDLGGANKDEFTAYRILYYIYTKNTLDLTMNIGSLNAEEKEDECVKHALQVAHAWCMNNYHRFFWLYQCSPKMSSYLIDWFIERERKSALKTMIKAYRQSLPVIFVAEKLGFESVEKFLKFASPFNLTYSDIERSKIDCKASMASLNNF